LGTVRPNDHHGRCWGVGRGGGGMWVERSEVLRHFLANPPRSVGGRMKRRTGGGHGAHGATGWRQ